MSDRIVVIRTAAGTKLFHAPEAKVALEIDEYDPSFDPIRAVARRLGCKWDDTGR